MQQKAPKRSYYMGDTVLQGIAIHFLWRSFLTIYIQPLEDKLTDW